MSVAMQASNDMADRMRSNPIAISDGYYDNIQQDIDNPTTDPACGSNCSSTQIAQFDAYAVFNNIIDQLPEPTLSVTNVANNVFTIEITWLERNGTNSETKRHRVSFLPYNP